MSYEAEFRNGAPLMTDYTPIAAIAAGEVVVVGALTAIAHQAISANALGALAVGGGVYRCVADGAIASGTKVYWNDAANKITTTAIGNTVFGYVAPGSSSAADGDLIDVVHTPAA